MPSILSKFAIILLTLSVFPIVIQSDNVSLHILNAGKQETVIPFGPKSFGQEGRPLGKSTKVFIIIHGWLQSSNDSYVHDIKNHILRTVGKDATVITVDWSQAAKHEYEVAKKYNPEVAKTTTELLSLLVKYHEVRYENIEIICHCMGCHIAGIACKNISSSHEKKIGKIIALDPSGPGYFDSEESKRLSPDDANIVFVVHTDSFVFGYGQPCGTIDFYPNGGKPPQPGCLNVTGVVQYDLCSHQRSVVLFIESLNDPVFYGIKCPSYSDYKSGLCSSNPKVNFAKTLKEEYGGTYFYSTNEKKPFLRKN